MRHAICVGLFGLMAACSSELDSGEPIEPLDLPEDPAASGVPVGVRTLALDEFRVEIWYPAPDSFSERAAPPIDYEQFVPESVLERLGTLNLPSLPSRAHRDAPVRLADDAYPVVVFSHGFGGSRLQSVDYAEHLASRGYVVAAADHPGRMFGDVLPCLFSPALEGCDLTGFGQDPATEHVPTVVRELERLSETGWLKGHVRENAWGLSGHSAGGYTTASVGEQDERFGALLVMAAGGEVARDVPTLLMDGSCDGVIPTEDVDSAYEQLAAGERVRIVGAGHLAFSDLCTLELGRLADEVLAARDDVNDALLPQLIALGTDGCLGIEPVVSRDECASEYLSLETSARIVRHMSTVFFDEHLRGLGPGVAASPFPDAETDR